MRRSVTSVGVSLVLMITCACNRRSTETENTLLALVGARDEAVDMEASEKPEPWKAALEPRSFRFPDDHAAHNDHRIEWWYYTGNLESTEGRRFGYQLTFFRTGIRMQPQNVSRWAVRDVYTVHFAISDVQNRRHLSAQHNSRGGVGWAGADTDRYRVWHGQSRVWLEGDQHRLVASEPGFALDLALRSNKPPALHGDRGLSRKGPTEGNASHYYSFTRLLTTGTITLDDQAFTVTGNSWMDHEFSTSFLEEAQAGWDWFAIQLENGVEIMLYRMRRTDGSVDPFSSGSLVDQSGQVTHLTHSDFVMEPLETWRSPATGADYPLKCRVELPRFGYKLRVQPSFDQQEMTTDVTTGINYWEGSIQVEGQVQGQSVDGLGYLELTGYTGQSLGTLFSDRMTYQDHADPGE